MHGDLSRLLDTGKTVVLFQNDLGSYTAFAVNNGHEDIRNALEDADEEGQLTDDFSVPKVMARLADKVLRVGEYE